MMRQLAVYALKNWHQNLPAKKVAIACHKMTNVMGRPRHMMLFEVTDISPAGAGSEGAVVPVNLSTLADLGDAVQMGTRYGCRIWPA